MLMVIDSSMVVNPGTGPQKERPGPHFGDPAKLLIRVSRMNYKPFTSAEAVAVCATATGLAATTGTTKK